MKTITRDEYDQLTFYASMSDELSRMQDRFYYYSKKILKTDDEKGWLTDYLYNNAISATELLNHLDIEIVEDTFVVTPEIMSRMPVERKTLMQKSMFEIGWQELKRLFHIK